ncbi:hypothetical protein [Xenorhabdus hominickii]|uniref:Uncharacterized protein n=1 Tax=Xenorhabdus hominickii TaxID=351679 RepID=A0A2G0Q657_XENHO|nr:hypothetical protein [Xenorhabdus hominickii]AOM39519.1 hypothetical protein A9255_02235 [Xenorhabdus hominickii]PHM54710.1 hypothetical protein Xhom_02661 [Xenorhabdus hominickii]
MSIEEILCDTAQSGQAIFKGKSHNIGYIDVNILPEVKKSFYTDEGLKRRYNTNKELYNKHLSIRSPNQQIYKDLISNKNLYLVGNCLLLAIFYLQHLKKYISKHFVNYSISQKWIIQH